MESTFFLSPRLATRIEVARQTRDVSDLEASYENSRWDWSTLFPSMLKYTLIMTLKWNKIDSQSDEKSWDW